jgi:oxygen-independent coproporphyrinogen-3 oxidase
MVNALVQEIALRKDYLAGDEAETIYFGGGTPSLLETAELKKILTGIKNQFPVNPEAEITLEANPDDITEQRLAEWKETGINRLSIGIQSFFEEDLLWMNRAHNATQAVHCLEMATRYFDNITIDLIYGTPGLTDDKWRHNVEKAIGFNIPHLSCYALTVEPRTPLDKMIREFNSPAVDPDQQAAQFVLLMQWMREAGYEHYEISNFAKPGWRSRHNAAYWQAATGKIYIGLGPSAHSFNGTERQWNVSNNITYIHTIERGEIPAEKEILTGTQQLNEYIMTSLRTIEGISLDLLATRYNVQPDEILNKAARYTESNLLKNEKNYLVLTNEGKLLADGIAAELFF